MSKMNSVPVHPRWLACALVAVLVPVSVAAQTATSAEDDAAVLDTVQVTGTLLRGIAPTGTSVVGISREDIRVLGKGSTNELLATTPQVSNLFNAVPMTSAEVGRPTVTPSIRNLSQIGATTLTLLNGQRMAGAGIINSVPDPSAIPAAVIERVEVVLDGGSSIYGSDAVAGVINFITRRRFDGVEVSTRYGTASGGYWQSDHNLTMGRDWGSGSALLSYAYVEHSNLLARERAYMRSDHSARGGDDFRVQNCAPGNVVADGVTYALPGWVAGPGNWCDENEVLDFYPAERRNSWYAALSQRLSERVSFDATAYWSSRATRRQGRGTRDGTGLRASGTITSANPYFNAIGTETAQQVMFSLAPAAGGDTLTSPQRFTSMGVTPTLSLDMGADWQLKLSGNFSRSTNMLVNRQVNTAAITDALAATSLDAALNPYDVGASSPEVIRRILDYGFYGESEQDIRTFRAVADGSVFSLPAGEVKLALGAEHYRAHIDSAYGPGPLGMPTLALASGGRRFWSIFSEALLPLLGDDSAFGAVEMSLSARYDRYNDVGSTTNPKIGFNWYPLDYLRIRGNWGTSFHAPNLTDTVAAVDTRAQVLGNSPFRQAGSPASDFLSPTILLAGGNPDLKPEEADTWSFGFDWTPAGVLDGLSVSMSYYSIKFSNAITIANIFSGPAFYANPGYAPYWILNPTLDEALAATDGMWVENVPDIASLYAPGRPAPYVLADARRQNLSERRLAGLDFNLGYARALGPGDLSLNLGGTYSLSNKTRATAGSPQVDQLPLSSRYSVMGSLGYQLNALRSQLIIRTNDGYTVSAGTQTRVSSFTVADLAFGWQVGGEGVFAGTLLSLNLDNVLNRNPPFYNNVDGYLNGSTLGRLVTIGISRTF